MNFFSLNSEMFMSFDGIKTPQKLHVKYSDNSKTLWENRTERTNGDFVAKTGVRFTLKIVDKRF